MAYAGQQEIVIGVGETPDYNPLSPQGVRHELYHLVDDSTCGPSALSDTAYSRLNRGRQLYTGILQDLPVPTLRKHYPAIETAVKEKLLKAKQENDRAGYCAALAAHNRYAAKIVAFSPYMPYVVEDKAEVGSQISDPEAYKTMADPNFVTLNRKFSLLLSRVYDKNPGVARYFAATSPRRTADSWESFCTKATVLNRQQVSLR